MKKQIVAIMLGMTMMLAAGCGASKQDSTESTNNTQTTETEDEQSGVSSVQMGVKPAEHVTQLCDYSAVPVSVSSIYELTDENVEEATLELLNGYGIGTKEVTDRTVVEAGDYVNVDYTGYQNGEAFSGGTATDVLIDVSNNCDVNSGNGYISGFSDGLLGAEVGSTIDCDVTFPEEYGVESLNGQTVTFQFVINGIYEPVTLDTIEDAVIEETFGADYGITTKDALMDFVRQYIDASRYSAVVSQVKSYVVENSTFDIPQEYLNARLAEYETTYQNTYCAEGQSLEDYFLTNFSMALEDAEAELMTYLDEQVSVEFAFAVIADEVAMTIDEEEYAAYVQNFITSANMNFTTEDDVYNYFGAGNVEDGEEYLRGLYLVNKAIDHVAENAVVTYTE